MKLKTGLLTALSLILIAGFTWADVELNDYTIEPAVVQVGDNVTVTGSFSSSAELGAVVVVSHRQPETFRKKVKLSGGLEKTEDGTYTFSATLKTRIKNRKEAEVGKHILRLVLLGSNREKIGIVNLGKLEVTEESEK